MFGIIVIPKLVLITFLLSNIGSFSYRQLAIIRNHEPTGSYFFVFTYWKKKVQKQEEGDKSVAGVLAAMNNIIFEILLIYHEFINFLYRAYKVSKNAIVGVRIIGEKQIVKVKFLYN